MADYTTWRKVPAKKVLDYADQVGDEQAAKEFCINVDKIKGLRVKPSETVTINGYTQPEKLKILAKADEVGDTQASNEFKVSKTTIAKWRKKLKKAEIKPEPIPETKAEAVEKAMPETRTIPEPVAETIVKPQNVAKVEAIAENFIEESVSKEYVSKASSNSELLQKLILENEILKDRLEIATHQLNTMKSAIMSLL